MAKTVAEKLLLKPGQTAALVGAPAGQQGLFAGTTIASAASADAVVVYGATREALAKLLPGAVKALRTGARLWVCYPKAGQLGTDLSRDLLAKIVAAHGFEGVRLVAVDEVWSAMMFLRR